MYKFRLTEIALYFPIAVAVLFYILSIPVEIVDQDEAMYSLVALSLLDGNLPYETVFDHKPIGIYYVYALTLSIFGKSFYSIRIVTLLSYAAITFLLARSLRSLGFTRTPIIAACTTVLAFPLGFSGSSGNTEIFQTLLLAILFFTYTKYISTNKKLFLFIAGIAVGVGFSINYLFSFLGLFSYIAFFIFSLLHNRKPLLLLRDSLYIFIAFLITTFAIYSPYLLDMVRGGDLFEHYFKNQFEFLSSYSYPLHRQRLFDRILYWVLPYLIFIGFSVRGTFSRRDSRQFAYIFGLLTLFSSVIAACSSMSFFHHYWILATIPLACTVCGCIDFRSDRDSQLVFTGALAVLLVFNIIYGGDRVLSHHLGSKEARQTHQAFQFIESNISKDEPVVSINVSPAYIFVGQLKYDQKYVFPNHIPKLHNSGLVNGDQYFLDLLAKKPKHVLLRANGCESKMLANTCKQLTKDYKEIAYFNSWWPVRVLEYSADF